MKIKLDYKKGWYGRYRKLKIMDSDHICLTELKQGERKEVEVSENAVFLYGKVDWGKTESIRVQNTSDGRRIEIHPYFSLNLLRGLGIMKLPIKLSFVDDPTA